MVRQLKKEHKHSQKDKRSKANNSNPVTTVVESEGPATDTDPGTQNLTSDNSQAAGVCEAMRDNWQNLETLKQTLETSNECIETSDEDYIQIIKNNYPQLVNDLQPQLFIHMLTPFVKDTLDEIPERKHKTRALLNRLMRGPRDHFDQFCETIAGLHPDLFLLLKNRNPTQAESECYLRPFCEKLRDGIICTGSKTDNAIDRRIDLDAQFVPLKIVDISGSQNNYERYLKADDTLPEFYQYDLEAHQCKDVEISDIIPKSYKGKTILLTGRGGVGKSTLIQYLNRLWAKGEWGTSYAAFFLLNLRKLVHIQREITISQLLGMYSEYVPNPLDPKQPALEWLVNNQECILFGIDGIDELASIQMLFQTTRKLTADMSGTPLEWCVNFMQRNIMEKGTLLLISRPFTELKRLNSDWNIDVLGLTPEKVNQFVDLNVTIERQETVKDILHKDSVLLSISLITFYCAAICRILEEDETIDSKELNTYTRITAFIITHFASRKEGTEESVSLLPEDLYECLPLMAELAYNGLSTSENNLPRLVFTEKDFIDIGFHLGKIKQARRTGLLLSLDPSDMRNKDKANTFQAQFLHFSIQEFLAAAHMIKTNLEQVDSFLRESANFNRLDMRHLFLLGLAFDTNNKHVAAILKAVTGKEHSKPPSDDLHGRLCNAFRPHLETTQWRCILQLVQAAYESQSPEMAQAVGKASLRDNLLFIGPQFVTAIDMKAVTFVMLHSPDIKTLLFGNSVLDNASACELRKYLQGRCHLNQLILNSRTIGDNAMKSISDGIKTNTSLLVLDVNENKFSVQGMQYLVEAIKTSNIQIWRFQNSEITDELAKQLSDGISNTKNLKCLQLWNTKITTHGMLFLAKGIKTTKCLEDLTIQGHQISSEGMAALSNGIKYTACLKCFRLFNCQITEEGMRHLSEAIKAARILTQLHLTFTQITNDGTKHLANGLKMSRSLERLRLWGSKITAKGMKHLSDAMKTSVSLNQLELLDTRLTAQGWKHLAEGMKKSRSLRKVVVSQSDIELTGAVAMADAICCHNVKRIELMLLDPSPDAYKVLNDAIVDTNTDKCECVLTSLCSNYVVSKVKDITSDRLAHFTKGTANNKSFQVCQSLITEEGARRLSEVMKTESSLIELHIMQTPITENVSRYLASGLKASRYLKQIKLCKTQISEKGIEHLCDAMTNSISLNQLGLLETKLTDQGWKHLAKAIKTCTSLRKLVISQSPIDLNGAKAMANAMLKSNLTQLDLLDIDVTPEPYKVLECAIEDTYKCDCTLIAHATGYSPVYAKGSFNNKCVKMSDESKEEPVTMAIMSGQEIRNYVVACTHNEKLKFVIASTNIGTLHRDDLKSHPESYK